MMSDETNLLNEHEELEERELLISRVLDGEASAAEFDRLRSIAAIDSSIWRDLGEAQRLHDGLGSIMEEASTLASRVELEARHEPGDRLRLVGGAMVGRLGGWIAAAIVLTAWVVAGGPSQQTLPDANRAGLVPAVPELSADEALQQYLSVGREQGKVIGELPGGKVLERRPLEDGSGYEVLYVRPILERAIVTDVYRVAEDEAGNAKAVPVETSGARGAN